jgi:hypothetical protein
MARELWWPWVMTRLFDWIQGISEVRIRQLGINMRMVGITVEPQ